MSNTVGIATTASVRHSVDPVLKRNKFNPMLELVDTCHGKGVFMREDNFSLRRSDDLRDFQELKLLLASECSSPVRTSYLVASRAFLQIRPTPLIIDHRVGSFKGAGSGTVGRSSRSDVSASSGLCAGLECDGIVGRIRAR